MEHVDGVALLFIRTPLLKKSDSRSSLPLVNEIHDRWGGGCGDSTIRPPTLPAPTHPWPLLFAP